MNNRRPFPSTSTKSRVSIKSTRTSSKLSTTPTKSTRTSIKSPTTPTKSTRTSSKSSTTSVKPFRSSKQQTSNSATIIISSISRKEFFENNSNVTSQENGSFCHPNCTGAYVAIVFGSLCGVALVILAFFVASRIYKRRHQAKSGTALSTTNSDLSSSTTDIIDRTENNYESNEIDAHAPSAIANNRNATTLYAPQVASRSPPFASDSNITGLSRISDHPYAVAASIAKQNPNPTQANSSRIYLELISGESYAGSLPPSERPASEEQSYYNVGSLMGVDNIEYEICDFRMQPASSVAPNRRKAPKKGPCASSEAPAMASTSNGWNRTVRAEYDNFGLGFHRR